MQVLALVQELALVLEQVLEPEQVQELALVLEQVLEPWWVQGWVQGWDR